MFHHVQKTQRPETTFEMKVQVPSSLSQTGLCFFSFAQPIHSIMSYSYKQVMVKLLKIHLHPSFLRAPTTGTVLGSSQK